MINSMMIILVLILATTEAENQDVVITTKPGRLKGVYDTDKNFTAFWGVPYAKPPIGELRWRPPVELPSSSLTVDAKVPGDNCMQPEIPGLEFMMPKPMSEDCLFMNIYIPGKVRTGTKLPIMIWLYSIGNLIGSGKMFHAEQIIKNDVIVVTVNFRLGVFGFYFPEYLGNLGLHDQRLAMKILKENADALGGDPNRITIFGPGPGGQHVNAHMFSPKSTPYFDRGISQSGVADVGWIKATMSHRMDLYKKWAKTLGCFHGPSGKTDQQIAEDIITCMRKLDAEKLKNLEIPLTEVLLGIDNDTIRADKAELMKSSDLPKRDYMIGTNDLDGSMLVSYDAQTKTLPAFIRAGSGLHEYLKLRCQTKQAPNPKAKSAQLCSLKAFMPLGFPENQVDRVTQAVMKQYKIDDLHGQSAVVQYTKALSDFVVGIASSKEWEAFAERGSNVYVYWLTSPGPVGINPLYAKSGASFGDEINYIWGSTGSFDEKQKQLAKIMRDSWTNFAKKGDPNPIGDGTKKWKKWKENEQNFVEFNAETGPVVERKKFREDYLNFWKKLHHDGSSNKNGATDAPARGVLPNSAVFVEMKFRYLIFLLTILL